MLGVNSLVKEFTGPDMQAYISEYLLGDLSFKTYFPTEFTPFLTFEALQAQFGAKVAADIVAFDSRAPRKKREVPGKVSGDLPKIEIARVKKESDFNMYRQLVQVAGQAQGVTRQQALKRLIDWMYEDTTFTLNGVNARAEWMAKQIASTGGYKLSLTNNEGGVVTPVEIKFGIPTANIANSGTNWWAAASVAKPITDIRAVEKTARGKGFKLLYLTMDKETFDQMVLSDEVIKYTASYVANALNTQLRPTLETVNIALRGEGLPQVRVWDSIVNLEAKTGVYTATSGWELGNVTLTIAPTFGSTQWTTPADAFVGADVDKSTKSQSDFITVKSWAEQDPITVVTKAVAIATPVLNNANATYIMKTKQS